MGSKFKLHVQINTTMRGYKEFSNITAAAYLSRMLSEVPADHPDFHKYVLSVKKAEKLLTATNNKK